MSSCWNVNTLLLAALPTGLLHASLLGGYTAEDIADKQAALAACIDTGLLVTYDVAEASHKPRRLKRYRLTDKAISYLRQSYPGMLGWLPDHLSVRGNRKVDDVRRLIRKADAQTALRALGIETATSAIAKGYNPFVLGFPNRPERSCALNDIAINAQVRYVREHNLPPYEGDADIGYLFLARDEMPPFLDVNGYPLRNNSDDIGVLIDYTTGRVFRIFRFTSQHFVKKLTTVREQYGDQIKERIRTWRSDFYMYNDTIVIADSILQRDALARKYTVIGAGFDHCYLVDFSPRSTDLNALYQYLTYAPNHLDKCIIDRLKTTFARRRLHLWHDIMPLCDLAVLHRSLRRPEEIVFLKFGDDLSPMIVADRYLPLMHALFDTYKRKHIARYKANATREAKRMGREVNQVRLRDFRKSILERNLNFKALSLERCLDGDDVDEAIRAGKFWTAFLAKNDTTR